MVQILLLLEVLFTQNNLRLKICPLVLHLALNLVFSSIVSSLAWGVSLFKMDNFARMTDEADNNSYKYELSPIRIVLEVRCKYKSWCIKVHTQKVLTLVSMFVKQLEIWARLFKTNDVVS